MGSVVNIKQLSRFKMNQIILIFAFFGSAVLCEEVARKPKLFFVSTSATTSTLQTASICYVTLAPFQTCTGRKRRSISLDGTEPEGAVQPSTFKSEGEHGQGGKVPPLLDHHHLHLHLHLLHNHLLGFKRTLHTGRRKRMCIDLNLKILNIFRLVVFV